MSRALPELYLSRCHSRVSSRRATAGRLLAALSSVAPEHLGDPTKPGRDQVALTEQHSAPPAKRNDTTLKTNDFIFTLVDILVGK